MREKTAKIKVSVKSDAVIRELIDLEFKRQSNTLNLIASENYVSDEIMRVTGSCLTNKYSEGYPGARYYPGNGIYDVIERLAQKRALKLFGLREDEWHVNVQPLSGSPANIEIYSALLGSCDSRVKLMGLSLASGGHLTHGHKVSFSGKFWEAVQYSVDQKTGLLDYDDIENLAYAARPRVIVSGFTAYPRIIDFKSFREIADKVFAYHVVDISHYAGLIAGRAYPSPFQYADVVMTTTHKSLRGPRGAVIFVNRKSKIAEHYNLDIVKEIDKAVFPGLQGGPHNHITAAKAVCFREAMAPKFRQYAKQIIKNAKILAAELQKLGFSLVAGGTDNHLMLVDVKPFGMNGLEAEMKLEEAGITANRNTIPGDTKPLHPSGLRLGTPALTTRGMKEKEMKEVALLIHEALTAKKSRVINKKVLALCAKFPLR